MSTIPETVEIHRGELKLIELSSWTWQSTMPIRVTSVMASLGGRSIPLIWSVWKFSEVAEGEGGSGVKAQLSFEYPASPPPAACSYWYDAVLWPAGAMLTLRCEYDNNPTQPEVLNVRLA